MWLRACLYLFVCVYARARVCVCVLFEVQPKKEEDEDIKKNVNCLGIVCANPTCKKRKHTHIHNQAEMD